jgi:hypothetical protein
MTDIETKEANAKQNKREMEAYLRQERRVAEMRSK